MAKKAYCEGTYTFRYLIWAVVVLTIGTLTGAIFYRRPAVGATGLPGTGLAATAAAFRPDPQAGVDGFTMATPKGGVKLIDQVQLAAAQRPAASLIPPVPLENIQEVLNNVAATVKPSVVHIEVMRRDPAGAGNPQVESIGSGILVDRRGYILTNYHVLQNALRIIVTTYSNAGQATWQGQLVHSDIRTDLAVIKIEGDADFPVAQLGDSSRLEVGDWVLAVGSPLDLTQTVSLGIVSALRETVQIDGRVYGNMIQTDAHINKGNSGGPLTNIYGEVIGINTAIYTPDGVFTGVGFAIPIDHARPLLDELNIAQHRFSAALANLAKPKPDGLNKGSWLGIEGFSLSKELAAQNNLPANRGVCITGVIVNSPAHLSGLQKGDIVLEIDERPVSSIDELKALLARTPPGRELTFLVQRAKERLDVAVRTNPKW